MMIFIENEPVNAKAYIDLISKKLGIPVEIYDSADNAIYDMTSDLFDSRIYYIINDGSVLKKPSIISYFNSSNEYVIIGFDELKVSDDFMRNYAQYTYTFEKADTQTLLSYIRKKYRNIKADDRALISLIEHSDHRLSQINNELDKVELLSEDEQTSYFLLPNQYPDIRTIDNMSVMLMIINKNIRFVDHIDSLINSAVQSLLAIYTMARKNFVKTNDKYYAKLMILCFKAHSSIIDGTISSENAIKKFVIDLIR